MTSKLLPVKNHCRKDVYATLHFILSPHFLTL